MLLTSYNRTLIVQKSKNQQVMKFIYTFKIYDNIVVSDDKVLYQLEHFKNKRTFPFKKLTYNKDRKAYRIYSQWVSKKRLYKLMIPFDIKEREDFQYCPFSNNTIILSES